MKSKNNPSPGRRSLRQQAETALTMTRAQIKKMSPEEMQHLVHELQVHQIELEMQNEQLRQTQLELEVARDRYATLFDFTPVGYATLNGQGRILEANLTLCQLIELPRSGMLQRHLEDFIAPEDQPVFRRHLDTLNNNAGPHSSDVLTFRQAETSHRVRLESCPERVESPGPANLIRIAIVDVTDREQREIAQEEQKVLMELVVDGVLDAIVTTDKEERIVLFNKAAEKMFRCPAAQAIGQPIDRFIPERFRTTYPMLPQHGGQDAVAARQWDSARHVMKLEADGEAFPAEVTISKVEVKGGSKGNTLFILVLRDITDQCRQQEERQRIGKLNSLGVLAGGLAHNFNNLLTSILGNVFMAKVRMGAKDSLSRNLEQAEQSCLKAKELTQQLLTFAKGGVPIKTSIALGDLLRNSTRFALSGSSISCHFNIPEDLRPLNADPDQIRQVIENLTINARQAMPQGGYFTVTAENVALNDLSVMSLPALSPGNYNKISFEDQGSGMEDSQLGNIFDPYYTTKPGASGLGLTTVHSIIQQHHGHISVSSKVGVGTTFIVYVPSSYAAPELDSQRHPVMPQKGRGRVLVMDDEPSIRCMVEDALTQFGYAVTCVLDGQAAIDLVSEALGEGRPFEVVILDLTIPGAMGGKDAIQHLLRLDPHLKAIVTSGYSDDPIMGDFQKYGFQGIMVKPYQIFDLAALLATLCAHGPQDTVHRPSCAVSQSECT